MIIDAYGIASYKEVNPGKRTKTRGVRVIACI